MRVDDNYPAGVSLGGADAPWNQESGCWWKCVNPRCPQLDTDWRGKPIPWKWFGENGYCPECQERGVPLG